MLERPKRSGVAARATARPKFDVLIAADMTIEGDRAFRIAEEIRHHARDGGRVGLVQGAKPTPGSRIAREVQTCVRRGLAEVVDPASAPATSLLVVHGPSGIGWRERSLAGIRAGRAILVVHDERDYAVTRIRQRLRASKAIVWAPVNPWLREAAPGKLDLTPEDWLPPNGGETAFDPVAPRGPKPVVGWIVTGDSPADGVPVLEEADVHPVSLGNALPNIGAARVIDAGQFSLDRLTRFDAFTYFPDETERVIPETLLRAALRRGAAVLLPQWLERQFGSGPLYCAPEAAAAELARIFAKGKQRSNFRRRKAKTSPRRTQKRAQAAAPGRPRPIMFLASNGVGVGHLSRLLAIARRVDPRVPVVFVSQAQAIDVVERFGYRAEYLPSAHYIGGDFASWDQWFAFEMERLIDSYDPALVVYDGNNPSDGLIEAAAGRRDCRLAWVRRGLWGNTVSRFFDNARWFDLIIEPGELDGQPDNGITARRRAEAQLVPPIRLLDSDDLLPREEAAAGLGLDPKKPAVLVQLGAGYNRDIVSLIDDLVAVLQQVPNLQICIAEWVNGAQPLNYWPGVKYLRGYPLSQYFRAFDFSVAAAGYNTFHEVIGFGLPTIFIPNRHPTMDDQGGRAEHAQALQAAFEMPESELEDLPQLVALLMDTKARAFLSGNSVRIAGPNGAGDAAQMLEELAWMAR